MASIGELTATVRADISGYVGPMRQVAQTNAQVAQSVGEVGKGAEVFKKVQHVAVLLSAETAGLGSHVGQLVNKFGMLAGSGGIMLAVAAAIAAVGYAFRKLTEDTKRHNEAIDGLVDSYKEATGAVVRLRLEEARTEMERTNRGRLRIIGSTSVGGVPMPVFGRVSSADEQTRAITALQQAQREYDQWLRDRHEPAEKAAAKAERERVAGLQALGRELTANFDLFSGAFLEQNILRVQKQIDQQRKLKASIEATAQAEREALRAGLDKAGLGDTKDTARDSMSKALQGARETADAVAHAFVSAFADNEGTIMDRIGAVLRAALLGAIEKLIAQKIFEGLLAGLTGGGSKGIGDNILQDLPIIGGIFSPPSAASGISGGATVLVPISAMPPAMSPVEYARDAQWGTLFAETFRVAEANGSVRFRRV